MAFIIDNAPDVSSKNKDSAIINGDRKTAEYKYYEKNNSKNSISNLKSKFESFSKLMGWDDDAKDNKRKKKFVFDELDIETGKIDNDKSVCNIEKEMEGSILNDTTGETIKKYSISSTKLKALNKLEKSKTKGKAWFNLPATEVTEEVKNDLEILQMRSALNPKHFYKKNDLKVLPKYFQMGTYIDTPLDYYNNRGVKKNKKRTLVDELMADVEFQKYNKRKYKEVIQNQKKTGYYKANKKMKKLKNKK